LLGLKLKLEMRKIKSYIAASLNGKISKSDSRSFTTGAVEIKYTLG